MGTYEPHMTGLHTLTDYNFAIFEKGLIFMQLLGVELIKYLFFLKTKINF